MESNVFSWERFILTGIDVKGYNGKPNMFPSDNTKPYWILRSGQKKWRGLIVNFALQKTANSLS